MNKKYKLQTERDNLHTKYTGDTSPAYVNIVITFSRAIFLNKCFLSSCKRKLFGQMFPFLSENNTIERNELLLYF